MSSYQPNIPTGTVNLNIDYKNLRDNFQELDTVYKIDHVALTDDTTNKGYHQQIHLTDTPVEPITTPTAGILYNTQNNDGIATDYSLFFKTALGSVIKMTRNFVPKTAANGYTFLPGGLILQWGVVNDTGGQKTVTLATANRNFPTAIYAAYATPAVSADPGARTTVYVKSISTTSIVFYSIAGSGSNYNKFYWWAIGI